MQRAKDVGLAHKRRHQADERWFVGEACARGEPVRRFNANSERNSMLNAAELSDRGGWRSAEQGQLHDHQGQPVVFNISHAE